MADSLFNDKVLLLQLYFPKYLAAALEDLLRGCNEDIDATKALILGDRKPTKRLALTQQPLSHAAPVPKRARLSPVATPPVTSNASFSPKLPANSPQAPLTPKAERYTYQKGRVTTLHTPEDVAEALYPYASLHLNFLPKRVADQLLTDLGERRDVFKPHQFYLFGNECVLHHGVAAFARADAVYPQLVYNGLTSRKPTPFTDSLEEAAKFTEHFINEKVIPHSERLKWQRDEPWNSDYCVVNYYERLQNNLQWHSDRLSHIGPHNYVASVSLGATRTFRLRSTHKKEALMFQIALPHNSLLLMRPGCQEEFKHCVNGMSKAVALHPKVGSTRYGLTFRHYPLNFIRNLPKCRCGLRMCLRRTYKQPETRGRYFWLCENMYQNNECGLFEYADFTNEEGHYIAKSVETASTWIAPDDVLAEQAQKGARHEITPADKTE